MTRIAAAVLVTLALGAAMLLAPVTATANPVETTAVVVRVVDGDTIDIRDDNRGRLRIRVLGIDTPETKKPGYTIGCWGPQATQFAVDELLEQRVALITDPTQDTNDRYGRTLAYLVKATDGTTPSRPPERAPPTPTSTRTTHSRNTQKSQPQSKKPRPQTADYGDHRATATLNLRRADARRRSRR